MFKTPWEMEHLARDRMERLAPQGRHPHTVTARDIGPGPARPLARIRRRCGQSLIAAGERLAGAEPRALQPLPAGSGRLGSSS